MFSKLVIVVLLAVTIGLYLKIVVMDAGQTQVVSAPQASIQVVEVEATATPGASASKALPEDQMLVIKQVFAPELLSD
jgi:FlaG/FlaF family flagellin (archaellin)